MADQQAPAAPQPFRCPSCNEAICVEAQALIPDSQKASIRITSEAGFPDASGLGGAIRGYAAIMRSVAKDYGADVDVFVSGVSVNPAANGCVTDIHFVIMRKKPAEAA